MNGTQMIELPLNGRNYTTLLETIPGAAPGVLALKCQFQWPEQLSEQLHGRWPDRHRYWRANQQFAYRINVDAIAELKVSTNSQAAEFGRASGAQVQTVTKSGIQTISRHRRLVVQARRIHGRQRFCPQSLRRAAQYLPLPADRFQRRGGPCCFPSV